MCDHEIVSLPKYFAKDFVWGNGCVHNVNMLLIEVALVHAFECVMMHDSSSANCLQGYDFLH